MTVIVSFMVNHTTPQYGPWRHHETCMDTDGSERSKRIWKIQVNHLSQIISMKIHNWIIPNQDDFRNKVVGNLVPEYD